MSSLFDTLPDGISLVRGVLSESAQQEFVGLCRDVISGRFGWRPADKPATYYYTSQIKNACVPEQFINLVKGCASANSIECRQITKAEISFFPLEAGKISKQRGNAGSHLLILSLGATAEFCVGSAYISARAEHVSIGTGDVIVFAERSSQCFRGVEKLSGEKCGLLKNGGRIALSFEFC